MKLFKIRKSILALLLMAVMLAGNVFSVMADESAAAAGSAEEIVEINTAGDANDAEEAESIICSEPEDESVTGETGDEQEHTSDDENLPAEETADDVSDDETSAITEEESEAAEEEASEAAEDEKQEDPADDEAAEEEDSQDPEEQQDVFTVEEEEESSEQQDPEDESTSDDAGEKADEDLPEKEDAESENKTDDEIKNENSEEKEDVKAADAQKAVTTGDYAFTLNTETNKYILRVTNFSTTEKISAIKVKTWSYVNGEDDAVWHTLKSYSAGKAYSRTSSIHDFKNYGKVYAEFYLVRTDGTQKRLAKKGFTLNPPKITKYTITKNVKKPSISVKILGFSSQLAISSIRVSVWREGDTAGKKTYTMQKAGTSSYRYNDILISKFGGYSGTYHVRVYAYPVKGIRKCLVDDQITIDESNGYSSFVDTKAGEEGKEERYYRLYIRGLAHSKGISSVEFDVWNQNDKQNVKTYKAKRDSSARYYCNVDIKSFKLAGTYKMNVYVIEPDGTRVSVKKKTIMEVSGAAGGTVTRKSNKPAKGTFILSMNDFTAPSGAYAVKYVVWTQSDKSDKYIYQAEKQDSGAFTAKVNIKNHKYNNGTFYVAPIVTMGNRVPDKQDPVKISFKAKNIAYAIDSGKGKKTVGIAGPSVTSNLKFAVWCTTDGQGDLQWYEAKQSGNNWTAEVDLTKHGEAGTYNVHVYSGSEYIASTSFTASKEEVLKNGYYYENGYKFYYINGVLQKNYRGKVAGPYLIKVNRYACTITVYAKDGDNGFIQPISYFPCSPGNPETPSPIGSFQLESRIRWKHFFTWNTYVQYAVRYAYGKYFHSAIYGSPNIYTLDPSSYNMLGNPASHGCIRLQVIDAKWIYMNKNSIADVQIYESADPGPFGKATTATKIPPTQTWDPTDPAV